MRLVSNLPRAMGAAAALAALALGAQAQTIGCEVGVANGGIIPASGTGGVGAVFPTTLPATPSVFPLSVAALPPASTVVTEVKLFGLTHTWVNDVHIVLEDPTGGLHNVFVRAGTATGTGYSCDFGGDYSFVPACTAVTTALPTSCTGATIFTPGVYDQYFGRSGFSWPSGSAGIFNTPLDSIPAATGTWNLHVYDWVGGDAGALTSWDLCFGTPTPPAIPTAAPVLSGPADLSIAGNPVTLTWASVDCASAYDVDLDGVVTTGVAGLSFAAPVLAPGTHTWTVRATNVSGAGPFATMFSFDVPPPPPSSTCVTNGTAAGLVPTSGTGGGGVYQTTLPPNEYTNTYAVTLPAGATQIVKVDVEFGTSTTGEHTFAADLQFVLTDPTGGMHNLQVRGGSSCDFNGLYSFYLSAGLPIGTSATLCTATGNVPNGDYNQFFNTWVDGTNGIFNTPLNLIPVASGNWTLTIYDWAGGDDGEIVNWEVCFDSASTPVTYCTAGTSTNGCVPAISATAQPSATLAGACVINVANVEGNKSGLIFYGINNVGFTPTPWSAGSNSFLCVKAPTQRMPTQTSGGTNGACNGSLTQDWNVYQAGNPSSLGNPFSVGDKVYAQAWYRDPPAPKTTNLSDALEMTMLP